MRSLRKCLIVCLALLLLFALAAPPEARAQPSSDTLRSLLPETLKGRTHNLVGTLTDRLGVMTRYQASDESAYPFRLLLGYGPDMQQNVQRKALKEAEAVSTVTSDGHAVHVLKDSMKLGMAAFPGKVVVLGTLLPREERPWDADAAREQLMNLLQALDLKSLAAFSPASQSAASQRTSSAVQQGPHRYPVAQDGQWGYIDSTGTMVIEPQFDKAARFSDGLARVKTGETVVFIDSGGNVVLEPEADSVRHFSEGLAPARREADGPFGYINKSGAFAIEPQFERAYAFSEGRAAVYTGDSTRAEAKFGYIDETGDFVVEPQFWGARKYSGGLAPVLVDGFVGGEWGFIDESGELVIEPQFDDALSFSEGRAAVSIDDDWGYIDKNGQHVIEQEFIELARTFSEGRAAVEHNFDGWIFLDRTGERVLEEYAYAEPFRGPLARVIEDLDEGESVTRTHFHQGGPMHFHAEGASWTYIDRQGRTVWP